MAHCLITAINTPPPPPYTTTTTTTTRCARLDLECSPQVVGKIGRPQKKNKVVKGK